MKVRDQLDSIAWIVEAMEPIGFHGGAELEAWRARTHRAYLALVDSMAPGHGDPLPPDVPPSVRPGVWPDSARTLPPQPPPSAGSKRGKSTARVTKGQAKPAAASKSVPRKAASPAKARPKKPAAKRAGKGRS